MKTTGIYTQSLTHTHTLTHTHQIANMKTKENLARYMELRKTTKTRVEHENLIQNISI